MSSYFDYFCKNVSDKKPDSIGHIKGSCYSMCPKAEVDLRERENIVHVLEVVGSSHKLVKSYSRSAADSNMAKPHLLRPYAVLKDTVRYLLTELTKREDVSVLTLYDFINDRLRAVRQDITIQQLPPEECASLLEPMIRFHIYFGYRLRNHPISDFDPVLNKKYLVESLKWFLCCCDSMEKTTDNKKVEELSSFMSGLNIGEKRMNYDRSLMESVYILCNLGDIHPLLRYLELPNELKTNPKVETAYKIAIANMQGNFIVAFRLMENLCPLSYCALCPHVPVLQRQALRVLSHAYSSRQLFVPAGALRRWLRLWDAPAAAAHYGLAVHARDAVRFSKADFNDDAPLHHQPMATDHVDKLWRRIEDVFVTCD